MQAEERIKELIIAKYGNVRAFATESGISYTTVRSILERGIMNAKAENVFKICHLLGISPDTLAEWGVTDEPQQPQQPQEQTQTEASQPQQEKPIDGVGPTQSQVDQQARQNWHDSQVEWARQQGFMD